MNDKIEYCKHDLSKNPFSGKVIFGLNNIFIFMFDKAPVPSYNPLVLCRTHPNTNLPYHLITYQIS